MELVEVLMNPVRQRIFQYLLVHETGTVKEIKKALPDIPGASLYRHVKILADNGVLAVADENRIRGTVEIVYKLNKSALILDDTDGSKIQMMLMEISAAFAKYFAQEQPDPHRDMLTVSGCTLTLTDQEFSDFLAEIGGVMTKYMRKTAEKGRKVRQVALISSPVQP